MAKRLFGILAALLLLVSCSSGRYARGLTTEEIREKYKDYNGTVDAITFPSGERHIAFRRFTVYLPPSYYEDTTRRYPVLYLLHGARGNEITWMDWGNAYGNLDSLVRKGLAKEFILVTPNMNRYFSEKDYRDGRAVNAVRAFFLLNGEAERHFENVIHHTDSLFRTIPEKHGRAIAGMSSGALQSIYLSANHPDWFDYVGLFSPYAYPTASALTHWDVYGHIWHKLRRQFEVPPEDYHIMIGTADFFYPHMRIFDRRLTRKGYNHILTIVPGGHEWYNWEPFLTWFCQEIFQD